MKKILLALLIAITTFIAGCGGVEEQSSGSTVAGETIEGVPEAIQDDISVAVIRNLPSDDHTQQFLDGARTEGESFGFTVDTYISDGDDARFQDLVSQAIQGNYDGIVVSHGKDSYSYGMLEPAREQDMEVVTFDTVAEQDGELLEGVTSTAQNDELLAEMSLDEVIHFAGEDGDPPRIIKAIVGGVVPLDNRNVIYEQYEEEGKIETVETIGPQDMANVIPNMVTATNAVLNNYGEGEIDAIWASWDELAKGSYNALSESNRSDVELISIDVSNQDINLMTEEGSTWRSTAAVDPYLIGVMNMRLLAKKIAGEETPEYYQLEPHVIRQEDLTEGMGMDDLSDVVDGWGESDDFNEEWMDILREN